MISESALSRYALIYTEPPKSLPLKAVLKTGLILTIVEFVLLATWAGTGVYVMVRYMADPHTPYLMIHKTFMFHFGCAMALMLAMEAYKVFWRVKMDKSKESEPRRQRQGIDYAGRVAPRERGVWQMKEHVGYVGSWAVAFVAALITDVVGVVELAGETGSHHDAVWIIEMVLASWGLVDTVACLLWSICLASIVSDNSKRRASVIRRRKGQ